MNCRNFYELYQSYDFYEFYKLEQVAGDISKYGVYGKHYATRP